jgi:hypothetical protein
MDYLACKWHHENDGYPIELYSELDVGRWEVRKVEVFRDGRMQFADAHSSSGDTRLGLMPVPQVAEIAANPEFTPSVVDQATFEAIWQRAKGHT